MADSATVPKLKSPRRTPCGPCNGTGFQQRRRPSTLYNCGFETYLIRCVDCGGKGDVPLLPAFLDHKSRAAGEREVEA